MANVAAGWIMSSQTEACLAEPARLPASRRAVVVFVVVVVLVLVVVFAGNKLPTFPKAGAASLT